MAGGARKPDDHSRVASPRIAPNTRLERRPLDGSVDIQQLPKGQCDSRSRAPWAFYHLEWY